MEFVSYLFDPQPSINFAYTTTLTVYALILFVIGIGLKIYSIYKKENKELKKTIKGTPAQLIWITIIILILVGSRIKAVPYLAMRFLLALCVALSVYFVINFIYKLVKVYPEERKKMDTSTKKQSSSKYSTKK